MKEIRVLIVDQDYFARCGIQTLLESAPHIRIVGEAENGRQAIQLANQLRPNILLIDLTMSDGEGIEIITAVKRRFAGIKVLILTNCERKSIIAAAFTEADADGYLLKRSGDPELHRAIEALQQGEMPLHPLVAQYLIHGGLKQIHSGSRVDHLTKRERQVLHLLAAGLTNKEAASILNISRGTVKIHVSHIFRKLNVSCRTKAVIKAVTLGLIQESSEEPL